MAGFRLWCIAIFVAMGTFLYGYDSGAVTITISQPSWFTFMDEPGPAYVGAVASVYSAGQAFGAMAQSILADRHGRVPFLLLLSVLAVAGIAIQSAATDMGMFISGRAISGFAAGGTYLTTTLYLCELAPQRTRGMFAGCCGLSIGLGMTTSSWIGVACSYASGNLRWRLPLALQGAIAVPLVVGLATFVPESPRYLIMKGASEKARTMFLKLRPDLDTYDAQREFSRIRAQIDYERVRCRKLTTKELWHVLRCRILVAFVAGIIPSLTGAQVVGYYQVRLYEGLGIALRFRLILAGVYASICFIAIVITDKLVIDTWGRRNLIIFGLIGVIVANIYTSIMNWQYQFSTNAVGKGFAVGGLYLLSAVHYAAYGSTIGIYQAELLPVAIRSKVMGITGFVSFAFMTGLTEAAPLAFVTIRQNFHYIFVGASTIFLFIVWFWFHETMGERLEEIPAIFGDALVYSPDASRSEIRARPDQTRQPQQMGTPMVYAILVSLFAITPLLACPIYQANTSSLERRWYGIKPWPNDAADITTWPYDDLDPGWTPMRYCYATEADYNALNTLVQAAIKLFQPAIKASTLKIRPDQQTKKPQALCTENGEWVARKDALMIIDQRAVPSNAAVGYNKKAAEEVVNGRPGHRLEFRRARTLLDANGKAQRADENDIVRMAHEFAHVIGLDHEQQRPDVRQHVDFHCENLGDYRQVRQGIATGTIPGYQAGDTIERACTDMDTAVRLHFSASQNIAEPVQRIIGGSVYSAEFDFNSITLYGSYDGANGGSIASFPLGAVLVGRQNGQNIRLQMGGNLARYVTSISEGDISRIAQLYPFDKKFKSAEPKEYAAAEAIKNNPRWREAVLP
ncbi:Major facilitator-type transporter ecdD [Pseudocercospora fuligena]|uniref:Major facilitator-type transporter ecdD n=1 Tax=Pseudocercospora fuligena TaxID=685502 RepID=A0A8H6VMU9_9PEZI|nr:Major facilitator-type transporter ecdD [Pseudocercospora fuligena]